MLRVWEVACRVLAEREDPGSDTVARATFPKVVGGFNPAEQATASSSPEN